MSDVVSSDPDATSAGVGRGVTARLLDAARDVGGRVTAQRSVVIEELVRFGGHCSAEQLVRASTARLSSIEASTVYRTLEALASAGELYQVQFGHGAGVWHLAGPVHCHAVCDGCGALTDIGEGLVAPLRRQVDVEFGFTLDLTHHALVGRCRDCS